MKKTIQILVALLALQLLLALGLNFGGGTLDAATPGAPLLAAAADQIDSIVIAGSDKSGVELTKKNGKWTLADGAAADAAKVKLLIEKLAGVRLGAPVATSAGAVERFKVGEGGFERRIALGSGGKALATVYLGTAQGRQTHLRRGDQNAVHAANVNLSDAPATAAEWKEQAIQKSP